MDIIRNGISFPLPQIELEQTVGWYLPFLTFSCLDCFSSKNFIILFTRLVFDCPFAFFWTVIAVDEFHQDSHIFSAKNLVFISMQK